MCIKEQQINLEIVSCCFGFGRVFVLVSCAVFVAFGLMTVPVNASYFAWFLLSPFSCQVVVGFFHRRVRVLRVVSRFPPFPLQKRQFQRKPPVNKLQLMKGKSSDP